MNKKAIALLSLFVALLLPGCAGTKTFAFQNAPGTVQIPGNWKDASVPGKSKATSSDGKAWVALSTSPKPSATGDIVTLANQTWKTLERGEATFQPAQINSHPGAVGVQSAGSVITVVGVSECKRPNTFVLIIASGEGVPEGTLKNIVTSYKE